MDTETLSDAWVVSLEEPTGHASGSFCLRPRSLAANVHPGQFPSLRKRSAVPRDLFGRTRRGAGLGRRRAGNGDGRNRRRISRARSAARNISSKSSKDPGAGTVSDGTGRCPVAVLDIRQAQTSKTGRPRGEHCLSVKERPSEEPRFHSTRAESLNGSPLEVQGPHVSGLIQNRRGPEPIMKEAGRCTEPVDASA